MYGTEVQCPFYPSNSFYCRNFFFFLLVGAGVFAARFWLENIYGQAAEKGADPVLYWKLDDVSTTANDASGNSKSGTYTGAVTQASNLCVSQLCRYFDGSGDRAARTYSSDTTLNPGTSSFTVSAWFKHTVAISGTDYLVSRFSGAGYKIYMQSTGTMCFGIDDDSTWNPDDSACSTAAYNDSQWHFLQAIRNGSTIQLYIDGKLVGEDTSLAASGSLSGSSPAFYVGIDSDGTSNGWHGHIDDVKVYTVARDQDQRNVVMDDLYIKVGRAIENMSVLLLPGRMR